MKKRSTFRKRRHVASRDYAWDARKREYQAIARDARREARLPQAGDFKRPAKTMLGGKRSNG